MIFQKNQAPHYKRSNAKKMMIS